MRFTAAAGVVLAGLALSACSVVGEPEPVFTLVAPEPPVSSEPTVSPLDRAFVADFELSCDPAVGVFSESRLLPGEATGFAVCGGFDGEGFTPPVKVPLGSDDFYALEAALTLPSEEPPSTPLPCPMMAMMYQPVFAQLPSGDWFSVELPADACGFPLEAVSSAMNSATAS